MMINNISVNGNQEVYYIWNIGKVIQDTIFICGILTTIYVRSVKEMKQAISWKKTKVAILEQNN